MEKKKRKKDEKKNEKRALSFWASWVTLRASTCKYARVRKEREKEQCRLSL